MKNVFFDSIVVSLMKSKNRVVHIDSIRRIFSTIMGSAYSDKKMYKLLYYLKNRWYLITLKKNIYFIKLSDDTYNEEWLTERFYWTLVKQHCKDYLQSGRYIGWLTALELHMSRHDVPDEVMIVNMEKQATEIIMFDKKVLFKTYVSSGKNLFPLYKKHIVKVDVGRVSLPIVCMEIALLETLYNPSIVHKWYIDWLIKKILKKHKSSLDPSIWATVVKNNKHHSSLNRLYTLADSVDKKMADSISQIIKKYSYFLDLNS